MIVLKDVRKVYKTGVCAINNISLYINDGEFLYVIGPTGSGKSTLIKLLNAEEVPTEGSVEVNNINVGRLRHREIPKYRRKIGVVFQDFRLLPKLTVFENIAYALEVVGYGKQEIRKRVREILKMVDLEAKAKAFPNELSGGQQQRVAIGRAIANRPSVLIADEPTGNLDPEKSKEIIEVLEKINIEEKTTIIMVTHDSTLVDSNKKRTIALEEGYIVADLNQGGYIQHE